jgi:hypothetical protein
VIFWIFLLTGWVAAVALVIPNRFHLLAWAVMLIGMFLNATVTIANRGFMPTNDPSIESHSIWAAVAPGHNLVFLGDNYVGFSIGDIIAGMGLTILLACGAYALG